MIEVESADIMASLLILKAEVEDSIGSRMRMVFSGAAEAHLIAENIGEFRGHLQTPLLIPKRSQCWCWCNPPSNETFSRILEPTPRVGVPVHCPLLHYIDSCLVQVGRATVDQRHHASDIDAARHYRGLGGARSLGSKKHAILCPMGELSSFSSFCMIHMIFRRP